MRAAVAALLLLALLPAEGRAQIIGPPLTCHYSALHDASGLDDSALGGTVVSGAAKQRCAGGDEVEVAYLSPVHLLKSGLCESVVYDGEKRQTGVLKLLAQEHCPTPRFETYVETNDISDEEFLALMRYWSALQASPVLPVNAMLARLGDREWSESERRSIEEFQRLLSLGKTRLQSITVEYLLHLPLPPGAHMFALQSDSCFRLTVMATARGFEPVVVSCPVP